MNDLKVELLEILTSLRGEEFVQNLGDTQSLRSKGLNSLGMIELIMRLQENYGINFNAGDLTEENLDSVEKLLALVGKYKA